VIALDLVHQLHRLDDAEHLALLHRRALFDKRRRPGLRGAVEGAHDRRRDNRQVGVSSHGGSRIQPGLDGPRRARAARHRHRRQRGVGRHGRGVDHVRAARLPDFDLEAVDFEFELAQVVFLDQVEDAADVV